jgi:hypothetical protein
LPLGFEFLFEEGEVADELVMADYAQSEVLAQFVKGLSLPFLECFFSDEQHFLDGVVGEILAVEVLELLRFLKQRTAQVLLILSRGGTGHFLAEERHVLVLYGLLSLDELPRQGEVIVAGGPLLVLLQL